MERLIWRRFSPSSLRLAFGYGSGVFTQAGNTTGIGGAQNMIDICFVVDNPHEWHSHNLLHNPTDYSFLRLFGPSAINKVQQLPAHVYYNTLVPLEDGTLIKYGVISKQDFVDDLEKWGSLYLSGRLHKPVKFLTSQSEFSVSLQKNLLAALNLSILLSPPKTSLSGDFRMVIGEDKQKVSKLVDSNFDEFVKLYEPILKKDPTVAISSPGYLVEICESDESISARVDSLPKGVKHGEVSPSGESLMKEVKKIVWYSSTRQSIKGILTAGGIKTVRYSLQKVGKMTRSLLVK